MSMLGIIGLLIGIILLIVFSYKQFSSIWSCFIVATVVIFFSGGSWVEAITTQYYAGVSNVVVAYGGIAIFAGIPAKLYSESGGTVPSSALTIKNRKDHIRL